MIWPFKLAFRLVSLVVAGILVYLAVTAGQVYLASRRDQAAPAQAIVVLGAAQYNGRPSKDLAARLDHALDLWHRGDAPLIVVTGGRQPGDAYSEAGAGARYLTDRGVPARAVLPQEQGSNSWQSLVAAARALEARGVTTVILVSDPFHNARIADMASELGLRPLVSPTRTSPITGSRTTPYFAKETAEVAVGRVIGFARLSGVSSDFGRVRHASGGG